MAEDLSARQEWKGHWPLVLSGTIGFSFHSVIVFSAGLFLQPLGQEFGWSRAQASIGLTMAALSTALLSPVIGAMIDRWGARRLAIPGTILSALVIASFALADGSMAQWLLLWSLYSLVALSIKTTVWTAAVTSVFSSGRSMALAVTLSGTAIAQMAAPPIARWLIADYGWREAYVWLGFGWGGISLLLILFFFFDAHDRDRKAAAARPKDAPVVVSELPGLTIAEALRCIPLFRIGASTLIMMFLTVALIVHQVPILSEVGVTRENGAYLASLSGLAGVTGKLATGWLMVRFEPGRVSGFTICTAAIGFLLLLEPFRSAGSIVVAMIITGYVAGAILQIGAYLTSLYAGLRNYGKIYGSVASMVALGAGLGPLFAGLIYDWSGGYGPLLLMGIPMSIVGGLLVVGLGPYPDHAKNHELRSATV